MKDSKIEQKLQAVELIKAPFILKWKIFAKLCSKIFLKEMDKTIQVISKIINPKMFAPVLGVIVVGFVLFPSTPPYKSHLSNANNALADLRGLARGGELVKNNSFEVFPTVYAEVDVNERIKFLVSEVLSETELAIENVEDVNDVQELKVALSSVNSVQDETIIVLDEVVENVKITDEKVLVKVHAVSEKTSITNQEVEAAIKLVEEAAADGIDNFEIEITTSLDGEKSLPEEVIIEEPVKSLEVADEPVVKEEIIKANQRLNLARNVYYDALDLVSVLKKRGAAVSEELQLLINEINSEIIICENDIMVCQAMKITQLSKELKNKTRKELTRAKKQKQDEFMLDFIEE